MTYTLEQFIAKLSIKSKNKITLISTFTKVKNKHEFECKKCYHRWITTADSVVNKGTGCPSCNGGTGLDRKSEQTYKKEIKLLSKGRVILTGKYVDNETRIKHKCLDCDNEYLCKPLKITCLKCKYEQYTLSQAEYEDKVSIMHKDKIEVLERYINSYTKINHFCKECGHIWKPLPTHIIQGHGCPRCNQGFCLYKQYKLNDNFVTVKGFEPQAIDYLIKQGVEEKFINVFSQGIVPIIKFRKNRRHFPDIFVSSSNTLYEVKGCATLGMVQNSRFNTNKSGEDLYYELVDKCKAAFKQKYTYEVLLVKNKKVIKLPKNWQLLTYQQFRKLWLKW